MDTMKRNIALLAFCQAIMMTCMSLMVASAALVGARLSAADPGLSTLPLAALFLGTMLTSIPASLLMRRIGRQLGFVTGNLVGAAGAALAAIAITQHSFVLFCLAAALLGVFNGFGIYYRFAAADAADDAYRSRAIAYVMGGGLVAAFAGPNLANLTREWVEGAAFAGSYGALVLLIALSLVALAFIRIPRPGVHEGHDPGRPLPAIARQPLFLVAVIGAALGYGIMSLVMTATPLAMDICGLPFNDTAFVVQWHVFAMFAPSFVTGHLIRRFGESSIMLWGALLNAGCVIINLTGDTLVHFWTALFMLGIGWNFLFVGGTSLLTRTYRPEEKAKAQALNDFLVFTTVTVASLSAGALQFSYGWQAVNQGVLPLIGLVLLTLLWIKRRPIAEAADVVAE